jgi:hypothetical protein
MKLGDEQQGQELVGILYNDWIFFFIVTFFRNGSIKTKTIREILYGRSLTYTKN